MTGMTLRPARLEEAEVLLQREITAFAKETELIGKRDDGFDPFKVEYIRKQILDPNSYYYVATVDGTEVGGIVLKDRREGTTKFITTVYISPEYQRRGYGRRMLLEARRRHGLYRWQVNTILQIEGNVSFYESAGFTRMSTVQKINGNADLVFFRLSRDQACRLNEGQYRFHGWETADVPPVNREWRMIRNPRELYDALRSVWSAETCAPRMREDWSLDNPTLGQCSITAFLAQDIFGGDVYGVPLGDGNYHCYNAVGGCVFDLTSEQFGSRELCYAENPLQTRETHFSKAEKKERYIRLKKALSMQVW